MLAQIPELLPTTLLATVLPWLPRLPWLPWLPRCRNIADYPSYLRSIFAPWSYCMVTFSQVVCVEWKSKTFLWYCRMQGSQHPISQYCEIRHFSLVHFHQKLKIQKFAISAPEIRNSESQFNFSTTPAGPCLIPTEIISKLDRSSNLF